MILFKNIQSSEDIKEVLQSAFSIELSIDGGWGYTQELATIILEADMPIAQLEHTIASMRTHIEMNMTLPKENRYAGINLAEIYREEHTLDTITFQKVTYQISAIQEELYKIFIDEYKDGYGKKEFDIADHFDRKKEATIKREISYWFDISKVL